MAWSACTRAFGEEAKQDRVFIEECFAGMLHSAKRKAGNQDEIVFGKRERLGEVVGEIGNALGGHLLDLRRFLLCTRPLRFAKEDGWLR